MLHEEIVELFYTLKSMTIFVVRTLFNEKEVIFIYFNFYIL